MLEIGVQTRNIIKDENPREGFGQLKKAGFSCVDFSLNSYLTNKSLYQLKKNDFFDKTIEELEAYFMPHKKAAEDMGIRIHQMHMPYPNYVPNGSRELNDYLRQVVAVKSLQLCKFFGCKYIVIHGFKLKYFLGSEEAEWQKTEEFLEYLAPMAKELGIILCVENLYSSREEYLIEGPCCDARKAVERIERINEKFQTEVLGFCLDTGHANLVGLDIEDFIVTLGSHLKVLHIHDNDGAADLHQIPYTFTKSRENQASTDWEGFLRGMKGIGFTGVLNFETAPVLDAFPDELQQDALEMLGKIGRYFSKKIS